MGLSEAASPKLLAGIVIGGIGLILLIVGMATPAWSPVGSIDFGAFRSCGTLTCVDTVDLLTEKSKVEAVQAMTIIGVLAGGVGMSAAVAVLVMAVLGKAKMSILSTVALVAGIVGFVFVLVGVIIWPTLFTGGVSLGYSWVLSLIGGILLVVFGVFVYKDDKNSPQRVGDA